MLDYIFNSWILFASRASFIGFFPSQYLDVLVYNIVCLFSSLFARWDIGHNTERSCCVFLVLFFVILLCFLCFVFRNFRNICCFWHVPFHYLVIRMGTIVRLEFLLIRESFYSVFVTIAHILLSRLNGIFVFLSFG